MKKRILVFFFIVVVIFCSSAYGESIYSTAAALGDFSSEIKLDTNNPDEVLMQVYEYDPRLEMYFGGYSGTAYSSYSVVNIKYVNTDIPLDKIYVAENEEEFTDLVTRGVLYCSSNIYIVLKDKKYSEMNANQIVNIIEDKCPLAAMGVGEYSCKTSDNTITGDSTYCFSIKYRYDSETLLNHRKAAEEKAFAIIGSNVAYNMPDYLKVKTIHDYIINNCKYGSDYESNEHPDYYTAYGALVEGKAVCQGYTQAAEILFDICGIENFTISGQSEGENHTWNAVRLDNEYYHIDVTWDDPVTYNGLGMLLYDYYNVDDNKLSENHSWDREKYTACTGTKYNYGNTLKLMAADMNIYSQPYSSFESVFSKYKPLGQDNSDSDVPVQIYELGIQNWDLREFGIVTAVIFVLLIIFRRKEE